MIEAEHPGAEPGAPPSPPNNLPVTETFVASGGVSAPKGKFPAGIAAGAAGIGATGGFSLGLFKDMNLDKLVLQPASAYFLTVFAFVAVVVLVTNYMRLPTDQRSEMRTAVWCALVFFIAVGLGGFGFQMYWQKTSRDLSDPERTVNINATIIPDLREVNAALSQLTPPRKLTPKIDDHKGHRRVLEFEQDVSIPVANSQELTVNLDGLSGLPDQVARSVICGGGKCNLNPSGGDNVHH